MGVVQPQFRCLVIVGVLVVAGGCGPSEPLTVSTIQVGRSLNPDNTVASHTTVFKPGETVFASALHPAAGHGTVSARWMSGSRVLDEPKKDVSYREAAATEFRARGFPHGEYSVEILVNGQSAGSRTFRVE